MEDDADTGRDLIDTERVDSASSAVAESPALGSPGWVFSSQDNLLVCCSVVTGGISEGFDPLFDDRSGKASGVAMLGRG